MAVCCPLEGTILVQEPVLARPWIHPRTIPTIISSRREPSPTESSKHGDSSFPESTGDVNGSQPSGRWARRITLFQPTPVITRRTSPFGSDPPRDNQPERGPRRINFPFAGKETRSATRPASSGSRKNHPLDGEGVALISSCRLENSEHRVLSFPWPSMLRFRIERNAETIRRYEF